MQAVAQRNARRSVAERRDGRRELCDARGIRAAGLANVEVAADPQHVAAIERAGRLDAHARPPFLQGRGDRGDLRLTRDGARARQDCDLVQHDGRVLDEDGIRQIGLGRKFHQAATERGEGPGVAGVLLLRERHVNGGACEVRELAASHGGAHGTDQCVHGRELCAATGSRFNIGYPWPPD